MAAGRRPFATWQHPRPVESATSAASYTASSGSADPFANRPPASTATVQMWGYKDSNVSRSTIFSPLCDRTYVGKATRSYNMTTRRNVQYSSIPTEDRDGGNVNEESDVDLWFTYAPKSHRKIPWKSVALALFLLLIGISLLSLSYFIFTSHIKGDGSQAYGLLFLGVLAFLPGYYETRVAYYSWRRAPGYTFASIPDY